MINQTKLNEDEKESWNRFVLEQNGSFLQSWEWGEFQKSLGREIFYLKNHDYQALTIKQNLPLGKSYLYCPRGPIAKSQIPNPKSQINPKPQISSFLNEITELAKREKAIFIRVEPKESILEMDLKELGFVRTKDVQPSKTLILDLTLSEQELLAQMHEKTRYNIGLAQRKGVKVRKTDYNEKDFENFFELLSSTAKRQKIRIFPKEYYRKQLMVNSEQFKNILFLAEYQGKIIAANMINLFGQTATYSHGGSDSEHRSLMAPHLLQWEQIKFAKNQSCKVYDFWGIDEKRWPGISRFKKGFGGREVQYIGAFNLILKQAWYSAYILARRIL